MRRTAVKMGALAALLLGGALAYGQSAAPPVKVEDKPKEVKVEDKPKDAPAKSKLEEMLQQALQNNPDLRLAAAKVAEADAELNRVRLLVVQKVGAAYQAVEAQKAAVETATVELAAAKIHHDAGKVQEPELRVAQGKLIDAKAKLAALETELPYLLGKQPASTAAVAMASMMGGGGSIGAGGYASGGGLTQLGGGLGALGGSHIGGGFSGAGLGQLGGGFGALGGGGAPLNPEADSEAPKPVPVLGKTAERIRAALDKPFSFSLKDTKLSTVIAEVSAAFQKANPGMLIKCNYSPDLLDNKPLENVKFEEMPFGAVLVWIEDSVGGARVVVRDYGLVIAPETELPPGAPTLHDFWKGAKGEEKAPEKKQSSNPPAEQIEGVVKTVNAAGLVYISIGSDGGVAKGNTLEVYRLDAKAPEQSKYRGRIKIIEVTPTEAVGQPIGKMAGPVKVGDQVSSSIIGD
jgi:hypothetical protein